MTKREQWVLLTTPQLQNILDGTPVPSPKEQLNNLILWLGDNQPTPGVDAEITADTAGAMGVIDQESMWFILSHCEEEKLISKYTAPKAPNLWQTLAKLTFSGWAYLDSLRKGQHLSRQAFMAMKFGDAELDAIYRDHFKDAVKFTGFNLKKLDESQPAGLIDDRLRVEIRQSRFLIADLTHHNKGAYWEAGFAEGLGKPVIYTCKKDAFENGEVHFDTNHHLIVIWEADKIGEAVEKLKNTIRATLPDEAKLED